MGYDDFRQIKINKKGLILYIQSGDLQALNSVLLRKATPTVATRANSVHSTQ